MKCQDCGQDLQPISPPQSDYVSGKTFRIPFTDICITIYHDEPTVQYDCPDCIKERSDDRQRSLYYAGYNDAAQRFDD